MPSQALNITRDSKIYNIKVKTINKPENNESSIHYKVTVTHNKKIINDFEVEGPYNCHSNDVTFKLKSVSFKNDFISFIIASNPGGFCKGMTLLNHVKTYDATLYSLIAINTVTSKHQTIIFLGRLIKPNHLSIPITYKTNYEPVALSLSDYREISLSQNSGFVDQRLPIDRIKALYKGEVCEYERYLLELYDQNKISDLAVLGNTLNNNYVDTASLLTTQYQDCLFKSSGYSFKNPKKCMNEENTDIIQNCVSNEIKHYDQLLNTIYDQLKKKMSQDNFKLLQNSQRQWIKYANLRCQEPTALNSSTKAPIESDKCYVSMLVDRIKELNAILRN